MSTGRGSFVFAQVVVFALAGQTLWPSPTGAQTSSPRPGSGAREPGLTRLFVVDDDATACRFSSSIQAAIDAASDGDVILVKPGVKGSVTITRKSLTLIGEGSPKLVTIAVKDLEADQAVVLRGFQKDTYNSPDLVVQNNAGRVWLEDCFLPGATNCTNSAFVGRFRNWHTGSNGGPMRVFRSKVVAYASTFRAVRGVSAFVDDAGDDCAEYWASPGGTGIYVRDTSSVALFDCDVYGGDGGNGTADYGFNCFFYCLPPANGGNGLDLAGGTQTMLLDVDLYRGYGGSQAALGNCGTATNGAPVVGTGALTTLSGRTGEYSASSPVVAGSPISLEFTGPPGWKCFVTYSFEFAPVYVPEMKGYSVVPLDSPTVEIGTLPAQGPLRLQVPTSNLLPPRAEAAVIYSQALFYETVHCQVVLGTPSAVVLLRKQCP